MSAITKIKLVNVRYYDQFIQIDSNEECKAIRIPANKRNPPDFVSVTKNTHLYNPISGVPIWLPVCFTFKKYNVPLDLTLIVNTKEKINVFDYIKELKDLITPEIVTILQSGLSDIVAFKDE